jgi:hypothetical protein
MKNRSVFSRFGILFSSLITLLGYVSCFIRDFIGTLGRRKKNKDYNIDNCHTRLVTGQSEWESLYSKCEKAHMPQSWAFGETKRKLQNWRPKQLVFEIDGKIVAICMILEKRLLGFFVISRINKGPLFLDEYPSKEVRSLVYMKLRSMWKYFSNGILFMATALEASAENIEILRSTRFWKWYPGRLYSSLIDLEPEESEMRKALGKKWRNRLNHAELDLQLNIGTSSQEFDWMMDRHTEHMQEKNFKGSSAHFIRTLHQIAPDSFVLLQAIYENQPVGGFIVLCQGSSAEMYIGWIGPEGREHNAGNFIFWNAALEAKRRGCRWLDLGGFHVEDKYTYGQFKRGMQGAEYELSGEYICF